MTHAEVDELNGAIGQPWARLGKVASSSDKFLRAIRKDMPGLEEAYLKDGFREKLVSDNSSAGLQDAYDGLFFNHLIRWGHGDKYYNRKFQSIIKAGSYKNIKAVLQKRGFNVKKKAMQWQLYDNMRPHPKYGLIFRPGQLHNLKNWHGLKRICLTHIKHIRTL